MLKYFRMFLLIIGIINITDNAAKAETWQVIFSSEVITSVKTDKNNNIWVGSMQNGLKKYNGSSWEEYNINNSGIPDNSVFRLGIDNNNIWLVTGMGFNQKVVKYNGQEWITVSNLVDILYSDCSDCNKTIDPRMINKGSIYCIFSDSKSNLWIGTSSLLLTRDRDVYWGAGLYKYNGNNWNKYYLNGNNNQTVYCITEDLSGNIWVGTDYGVSKYNGNIWQYYNNENSILKDNKIRCLSINNNTGEIWIGTEGKKLYRINGSNWDEFDVDGTRAIEFENNNVWVGGKKGISIYNGYNWLKYNKDNSILKSNFISSILFKEDIYIGYGETKSRGGLIKLIWE